MRDQLFEEYKAKRELLSDLTQLEALLEKLGANYEERITENVLFNKALRIAYEELSDAYNRTIKRGNQILKELDLI